VLTLRQLAHSFPNLSLQECVYLNGPLPSICTLSKASGSSVILLNMSCSSMKPQQHNRWGITTSFVCFVHSCPHLDKPYILMLTGTAPVCLTNILMPMCSPHPPSLHDAPACTCHCFFVNRSLCLGQGVSHSYFTILLLTLFEIVSCNCPHKPYKTILLGGQRDGLLLALARPLTSLPLLSLPPFCKACTCASQPQHPS